MKERVNAKTTIKPLTLYYLRLYNKFGIYTRPYDYMLLNIAMYRQ